MSSSIPSWQILTAHAQPFRGARDLAFCLKVPLDSLLVWASSGGSGETARMRRLAWTFAARIGGKYQIRLTRPIFKWFYLETWPFHLKTLKENFNFKIHSVWAEILPNVKYERIYIHNFIYLNMQNRKQKSPGRATSRSRSQSLTPGGREKVTQINVCIANKQMHVKHKDQLPLARAIWSKCYKDRRNT